MQASDFLEIGLRQGFRRDQTRKALASLSDEQAVLLAWCAGWVEKRHEFQITPKGDWEVWMPMAGRGAGKTELGSNWTGIESALAPNTRSLVAAPTNGDLRQICFLGESGLLNVIPAPLIKKWVKTPDPEITLWNGTVIGGVAAENPERFRGRNWHRAWCLTADSLVRMGDGTEKRLDQVNVGDAVMTRSGPKRVLMAGVTGRNQPIWRMELNDGRTIHGTMDHPVYVDGAGFVPLWEIQKSSDRLIAINTEFAGSSGRTATTKRPMSAALDSCTGAYTKLKSALSQMGTTFTTSMEIKRITDQKTWRQLVQALTGLSITQNVKGNASSAGISLYPEPCLLSAALLNAWKVSATELSRQRKPIVKNAGLRTAKPSGLHDFAAMPADTRTTCETPLSRVQLDARYVSRSSTARGATPSIAGQSAGGLEMRSTAVKDVSPCGWNADVYDLQVEGSQEFFANGILVHNCDEVAAWGANGRCDPEYAWDNMSMSVRLGDNAVILATTTPRSRPHMKSILADKGTVITTASTHVNLENLSPKFAKRILKYDGTKIGRQEIYGELIDAEDGGIISRSWLQKWPAGKALPRFEYVLMSLDTSYGDEAWDRKKQETDPTACSVWGCFRSTKPNEQWPQGKPGIMLIDCWAEHLKFPELVGRVKLESSYAYGAADQRPVIKPVTGRAQTIMEKTMGRMVDATLIEEKASGKSVIQTLAKEGVAVHGYNPGSADKRTRTHLISPMPKDGFIWVPESLHKPGKFMSWAEPLVEQLCAYSGDGSVLHDDLLDSTTQAWRFLDWNWLHHIKEKARNPFRTPPADAVARAKREQAIMATNRPNKYAEAS